jgi:nitroreductase
MELKEVIRNRHSVRSFSNTTPPKKIIDEIIEYANLAPSAGNLQARDFVIIDNHTIKEQLSNAAFYQEFIVEAPINIVVCEIYCVSPPME